MTSPNLYLLRVETVFTYDSHSGKKPHNKFEFFSFDPTS
jgi:hypothetical protein